MTTMRSSLVILVCLKAGLIGCNRPAGQSKQTAGTGANTGAVEAIGHGDAKDAAENPAPAAAEKPATDVKEEPVRTSAAPSVPGVRTHTVQRGETLWAISQKYYGDGKGWHRIYAANRNRIRDPNDVPVGTKLIIP